MSKTTFSYTWAFAGLILLCVGGLGGWLLGSQKPINVGHIQTAKVFASFHMTQELEAKLDNTRQARKTILDNLQLRMNAMQARQAAPDSIAQLQREFASKRDQLGQDNEVQGDQYNEQVWTQLNQYIQEFCEAKQLTYLFGASGSGNLMGADEGHDLTEEVIQFINLKYQNKL